MSIYKRCVCVCLGRQKPIKAGSRGTAVKYCWELHDEGPASGTLKSNRGCKTQNWHTYVHYMTQSSLNYNTTAVWRWCLQREQRCSWNQWWSTEPLFLFSNTNSSKKNYENFNKISSFFPTSKLTKPFHCTHKSKVSEKTPLQLQGIWWNLPCSVSKTRTPDAHSVWAERRARWAPAKNTPVCSVRVGLGANLGPGL